MNDEVADRMKVVIAFITARYKDDEAAAISLLGLKDNPTDEELEEGSERLTQLLLGVTDFAISQLQMMAMLVGSDMDKMIGTLGLTAAMMTTR